MIDGRFSYVEGRRSALFSLFLEAVGFAEEVFSIDGGFILPHLFRLGLVDWKGTLGSDGGRLGKGRFALGSSGSSSPLYRVSLRNA